MHGWNISVVCIAVSPIRCGSIYTLHYSVYVHLSRAGRNLITLHLGNVKALQVYFSGFHFLLSLLFKYIFFFSCEYLINLQMPNFLLRAHTSIAFDKVNFLKSKRTLCRHIFVRQRMWLIWIIMHITGIISRIQVLFMALRGREYISPY